jgi:hypothetical protein
VSRGCLFDRCRTSGGSKGFGSPLQLHLSSRVGSCHLARTHTIRPRPRRRPLHTASSPFSAPQGLQSGPSAPPPLVEPANRCGKTMCLVWDFMSLCRSQLSLSPPWPSLSLCLASGTPLPYLPFSFLSHLTSPTCCAPGQQGGRLHADPINYCHPLMGLQCKGRHIVKTFRNHRFSSCKLARQTAATTPSGTQARTHAYPLLHTCNRGAAACYCCVRPMPSRTLLLPPTLATRCSCSSCCSPAPSFD